MRDAALVVTLLAVTGVAVLGLYLQRTLRRDLFFVMFLAVTVVYVEVAPTLAMLQGHLSKTAIEPESPTTHAFAYLMIQLYGLVLFQLPMVGMYLLTVKRTLRRRTVVVRDAPVRILCLGMSAFAVLFVFAVLRNNVLFAHVGSEAAGARIVALPIIDYTIIRTYQSVGLFIVAVLFVMRRLGVNGKRDQRAVNRAFFVNLAVTAVYAMANSRLTAISLGLTLIALHLGFGGHLPRIPAKTLVRYFFVGLAFYYVAVIAVNARGGRQDEVHWDASYFTNVTASVFGDTAERLNCVDLMATVKEPLERQGAAMGGAWGGAKWTVLRFVNPRGFDEFRVSTATTAKTWMMDHYLLLSRADYASCTLTDLYGNFDFFGFLFAAVIFAAMFGYCAQQIVRPRSATHLVIALFVLAHALNFDREAGTVLFAWVLELPLLLGVIWLKPFSVVRSAPSTVDPLDLEVAVGVDVRGGPV